MSDSFYVGDAAGRSYSDGKMDHSDADLLFAKELACPFFTPEQFFAKHSFFKKVT